MKVLIAAGGTAGHINPALAIAGRIKAGCPEAEIHFAGRRKGMEYDLVTRAGYAFHHIEVNGIQRSLTPKNIARLSFATCEHSYFPALTAAGHRDFFREHFPTFRDKRFTALMDFFQLPLNKTIRSFSTGQKNQFEVILALSQGADYILMDEPFAGNDIFNREDFYKVLLGILEPNETILLSTHLLEEVQHFIGRAVLLHQGVVAGDMTTSQLEDEGRSLMDYVKEIYHYQSDRVSRALDQLTDQKE